MNGKRCRIYTTGNPYNTLTVFIYTIPTNRFRHVDTPAYHATHIVFILGQRFRAMIDKSGVLHDISLALRVLVGVYQSTCSLEATQASISGGRTPLKHIADITYVHSTTQPTNIVTIFILRLPNADRDQSAVFSGQQQQHAFPLLCTGSGIKYRSFPIYEMHCIA
ncbi:hypothetical protein BD289DRAFT_34243 [Coniella lustricola]|uniref:Uncharacterized protein n=1 Tax=Coniella lustricola TaxID=2025994 RepID=A0A2T3A2G2_9PEZI|nr:hypothetical protein BD289DRAFT_34243 [Coniella lustricola]